MTTCAHQHHSMKHVSTHLASTKHVFHSTHLVFNKNVSTWLAFTIPTRHVLQKQPQQLQHWRQQQQQQPPNRHNNFVWSNATRSLDGYLRTNVVTFATLVLKMFFITVVISSRAKVKEMTSLFSISTQMIQCCSCTLSTSIPSKSLKRQSVLSKHSLTNLLVACCGTVRLELDYPISLFPTMNLASLNHRDVDGEKETTRCSFRTGTWHEGGICILLLSSKIWWWARAVGVKSFVWKKNGLKYTP